MINGEKLLLVIAAYKEYFPNHWKDEMYKWEAIQHFQNHWDINAKNFLICLWSRQRRRIIYWQI